MNCPHCQKELPEKYAVAWCPWCGKNLPPELLSENNPGGITPHTPWWLFWLVLLAPAILATIGAGTHLDNLAIASPLFGGGIAGIVCGIMLAARLKGSVEAKVFLGFIFVVLMAFLSFALGFGGCLLGGGVNINLH